MKIGKPCQQHRQAFKFANNGGALFGQIAPPVPASRLLLFCVQHPALLFGHIDNKQQATCLPAYSFSYYDIKGHGRFINCFCAYEVLKWARKCPPDALCVILKLRDGPNFSLSPPPQAKQKKPPPQLFCAASPSYCHCPPLYVYVSWLLLV